MHLGSLNYRLIRMQTKPSLTSLESILFFLAFLGVLTSSVPRNFKRRDLGLKTMDNRSLEAEPPAAGAAEENLQF